ncbi:MAG TPA: CD225/dispanin family protein [Thermoanaerobaculia bacterium]|nr:CD225/dispanin family protein [Thermoanaerobaculia bacterium]
MTCPNCGTSNLDNASICANCGRALTAAPSAHASYTPPPPPRPGGFGAPAPGVPIPNYLLQSIFVTICCCIPLGIVAIIFSAQVNSKLAAGDIAGAQESSANAKKWCWIAFGVGIALFIIGMMFNGLSFLQAYRDGAFNR